MTGGHGEEIFHCPICLEDMTSRKPRALYCLHTFCEKCLSGLRAGPSKSIIRCPSCRKESTVPKEGIKGLPENFLLKACSDFVKNISDNKTLCHICKAEKKYICAQKFCESCKCYLCTSCSTSHNEHPLLATHQQVGIEKYQEEELCGKHGMNLTHYCSSCDRSLCLLCVSSNAHDSHIDQLKEQENNLKTTTNTNELREIVKKRRKLSFSTLILRNFVSSINERLDEIRTILVDSGGNSKELNKKLQKLISSTTDKYLRLKSEFESEMVELNVNHVHVQDLLYEKLQERLGDYSTIADGLYKELQVCKLLGFRKLEITDGLDRRTKCVEAETAQEKSDRKFNELLEETVQEHNKMDSEVQARLVEFEQDCVNINAEFQYKFEKLLPEKGTKSRKKYKGATQEGSKVEDTNTKPAGNAGFISHLTRYCAASIIISIIIYSVIQLDPSQVIKAILEPFNTYFQRHSLSLQDFIVGFIAFVRDCGVLFVFITMVLGAVAVFANSGRCANSVRPGNVYGMVVSNDPYSYRYI